MEYRSFDINVKCLELEGLNSKNMLFSKRVYAVVSVVGSKRSIQKTPYGKLKIEAKNKTWEWDYAMRFHVQESMVEENRLMVVIRLRRNSRCFCSRDKDIGDVYIPIKQLFYTINGLDHSGFDAYQVHSPSGKLKGSLKLWYKFNECSSRSASDEDLFNNQITRVLASSSSSARVPSDEVVYHYQVLSSAPSYYHVLPSAPPL